MHGFGLRNWSAATPTTLCMSWWSARIGADEPGFPAALRGIPQPVRALWYRGRLPAEAQPAVAMVGSRAATRAACDLAAAMAAGLAGRGYAVISGGALGVDAAAHRGALGAGGATFAVLGCGIDVVYPDRHGALFDEIAAPGGLGGLLSEYPPGTQPRPGQFPVRNRIVAALAEAVLVVEARPLSGALITARHGREIGRRIFAVPGSAGTDGLIAAGAVAVEDPGALLARLAGEPAPARAVPAELAALIDALGAGPASPAELARRLGLAVGETLGCLAQAELAGWARRVPGGRFEVHRGS
jgi:DNA processing protein